MSELINTNDNRRAIRWKLLTSVSAIALAVASIGTARAEDSDRPQVWIELGGQMENITGQGQPIVPDFMSVFSMSSILQGKTTPLQAQKPPTFSFGEEGSISFQPEGSDWIFSAGIRYGRSSNRRNVDHQTNNVHYAKYYSGVPCNPQYCSLFTQVLFANTKVRHQESHAIVDFSAGRDVGLGFFGSDSSSVVSFGVRFAQFTSREQFDIRARPDLHFKYLHLGSQTAPEPYFHSYHASGRSSRNFQGVGPSISWAASAPFAGNKQQGELALDWAINAGLLFGKQKTHVRHQQTGSYFPWSGFGAYTALPPTAGGHDNVRNLTVPNVGGSLGFSWRVQDFKVSLGYRADMFFGAMDTGVDTRKSSNVLFRGPYASISVGLGD